jgi:transcriptional antiterminator RfaH
MRRWYLVQTKPSGESLALDNLRRQGYEVYLPRAVRSLRRNGTHQNRITALFPRYVFVRLVEGVQALAPVRSSLGVTDIVRFGSCFAVVPDSVIDDLRSRANPESGLHHLREPPLRHGAAVSMANGPFEGLEGIFQREAGADRVIVLLRVLGRETPVRVPASHVLSGCAA